ncbi:hypothetical protein GCM10027341_04520 [Spirosoma knui]
MRIEGILLVFAFVVFTVICLEAMFWLLNQPSDYLLVVAGLLAVVYVWIAVKTKAFTKNPFKQ